jgi:hypothetical protein
MPFVHEALPKGRRFNQDYFIFSVLPDLMKDKGDLSGKIPGPPSCSTWTLLHATTAKRSQAN